MVVGFHAVLFDLDGTLVDTERESAEAMARAVLAARGIALDQEDRDFIIGRSWVDIYARLVKRYPGLGLSREQLIALTSEAREGVLADQGLTILPGALEVFSRCEPRALALVTGSSRVEAGQVLDSLGLRPRFSAVVCAEDVEYSKPHPAGYLSAQAQLGVSARDCLVIEDSTAGIGAGRAAGCVVLAVRAGNFHGQDQSAAHMVIDSLEELDDALLARLCKLAGSD